MYGFLFIVDHIWLRVCLVPFALMPFYLPVQAGDAYQASSAEISNLDAGSTMEKGAGGYTYVPHLSAVDGGFTTYIEVVNIHSFSQDFTFVGYDAQGNLVVTVTGAVGPREAVKLDPVDLFGNALVSHIKVTTPFLEVASVYTAVGIDGSPAHVSARNDVGDRWGVPLGDPGLTYDGLAVVNLGEADAKITARFLDIEGNLLQEQVLRESLAPFGKHLANLTALAPEGSRSVEIVGDQQLVLTALRGDFQSRFLWENQTVSYQSEGLNGSCGTVASIRKEEK